MCCRPRRERKVPAHLLKGDFESAFVDRALRKANASLATSVTTHMEDAQDDIIMDLKDMPKKSEPTPQESGDAGAAAKNDQGKNEEKRKNELLAFLKTQ